MIKPQRGIQSIEVGGALLAALVDAGVPLPLRELAQRAGMSSAKAHPYLVSYGKLGLVEQDAATGHYGLGPFALQLGLVSLRQSAPLRAAIPAATALAAQVGQTVALAVLGTHGPTVVHIHESARPIHVNMRPGTVMSLLNTATGRVFAAWLAPPIAQHYHEREAGDPAVIAQAAARQPQTYTDALLAAVRARGLDRAVGEPIPGINALSAPVFDHTGAIVLAVTAIGPEGSFDPAWDGALAHAVRACAGEISRRLGSSASGSG